MKRKAEKGRSACSERANFEADLSASGNADSSFLTYRFESDSDSAEVTSESSISTNNTTMSKVKSSVVPKITVVSLSRS